MTQDERINKCIQAIFDRESYFAEVKRAAAEAEWVHKMARAKAFLNAEGTIDSRKAEADLMTQQEMRDRFQKQAEAEIAYQFLLDARDVLSARRSLLSAEKARSSSV